VKIVIPGRPVPAVRMTQRGKFVKPQAQRYLDYKESVGWAGRTVIKSPISKQHEASVAMKFFLYGRRTPDIDNLIKAILDGLNGIAWEDDRQVVNVSAWRFVTLSREKERAEVEIKMLGEAG
jgi:crossover junction endodeoxyribonuclease RusA